jgi:hypothetical protein
MPKLYILDKFVTQDVENRIVCDILVAWGTKDYDAYDDFAGYAIRYGGIHSNVTPGEGLYSMTLEAAERRLKRQGQMPPYKVIDFIRG